jgi:hypothetical protein
MNLIDTYLVEKCDEEELLFFLSIQRPFGSTSYLLNTENNNMNAIEKLVYDLALHNMNEKNIIYDEKKHNIEFWWIKNIEYSSFIMKDRDIYEEVLTNTEINPLISSLTYFTNNNVASLLTDIAPTDVENNIIPNDKKIILSFPKVGKHILYDGNMYTGVCNILNTDETRIPRYILYISIWDRKPTHVPYYDNLLFLNYYYEKYSKDISNYMRYNKTMAGPTITKTSSTNIQDNTIKNENIDENMYKILDGSNTTPIIDLSMPKMYQIVKDINKDTIELSIVG